MKQYAITRTVSGEEIKACRKRMGLTQAEFAGLVNSSKKTVERWEGAEAGVSGPIVSLVKVLSENLQIEEKLVIPEKVYPVRLKYMHKSEICTIIDVDEVSRKIKIHNYTQYPLMRAFGRVEAPTFDQYEEFLESRCFPRTRDKMKLILKDLDLPFYEPFMIIEKTEGRMAEDDFWIQIER